MELTTINTYDSSAPPSCGDWGVDQLADRMAEEVEEDARTSHRLTSTASCSSRARPTCTISTRTARTTRSSPCSRRSSRWRTRARDYYEQGLPRSPATPATWAPSTCSEDPQGREKAHRLRRDPVQPTEADGRAAVRLAAGVVGEGAGQRGLTQASPHRAVDAAPVFGMIAPPKGLSPGCVSYVERQDDSKARS